MRLGIQRSGSGGLELERDGVLVDYVLEVELRADHQPCGVEGEWCHPATATILEVFFVGGFQTRFPCPCPERELIREKS